MTFAWFKRKALNTETGAPKSPIGTQLSPAELDLQLQTLEAEIAQGKLDYAGARLAQIMQSHPGDPRVLINLGAHAYLSGEHATAVEALVSLLQKEPENLRGHFLLAATMGAQGDHATALSVASKALAIQPRDIDMLALAANSCTQLGEYDEAARLLNRAIEFQPDSILVHHRLEGVSKHSTMKRALYELTPKVSEGRRRVINRLLAAHRRKGLDVESLTALLSMLEAQLETFPAALKLAEESLAREAMPVVLMDALATIFWAAGDARRLLELREACFDVDPQNLYFKLALSHAWLIDGSAHWHEAWRFMTQTLHQSRPKLHPDQVPLWEGEKLGKRKVLVYQDQGMGDAILAFRFLEKMAERGIRFDLWVFPGLVDLAARTKGYETLIRSLALPDPRVHGCDFAVPLFGLISALNLGPEDIGNPPVIRPETDQAIEARQQIAGLPGVRIGLVYGGNPNRRDDWERSLPGETLRTLAPIAGVSWVNLMVDARDDRPTVEGFLKMFDPMGRVSSFADTAAIVDELDAVVAVDSSVAHVAGNLGKPVWVLVPSSCDWRWQMGSMVNPWWPSARVLRSEAPGQWQGAVLALKKQVEQFVAARSVASTATKTIS